MQRIALAFPAYGYRRITAQLRREGVVVNHKRVLRLMREDNLLCLRHRRFVATTDSDHGLPVYPNLIPALTLTGINQLWVAEEVYLNDYETMAEASASIDHFLGKIYNEQRLYSTLGYLPPVEFEQMQASPQSAISTGRIFGNADA